MKLTAAALGCALVMSIVATSANAEPSCAALDWTKLPRASVRHALTPNDLVRLRDVGPLDEDVPDAHVFALSPDRRHVAFQVRRADPATNDYCLGMVVMALDGKTPPLFVDIGGRLIRQSANATVEPERKTGVPAIITPRWSEDGSSIFYLKNMEANTQIWRADARGGGSVAITHFSQDVIDFRLAGGAIVAKVRGDTATPRAALAREALTGFHVDERLVPLFASMPSVPLSPPVAYLAIDLVSGAIHPANVGDIARFAPETASRFQMSGSRQSCEVMRRQRTIGVPMQTQIVERCGEASPVPCTSDPCSDTVGQFWAARRGVAIRFMRREGWAHERTSVYEWAPATGTIHRLFSTAAFLIDCQPRDDDRLLCLRETSLRPRHFVTIDVVRHAVSTVANLNPEFAALSLGRVRRILLRSDVGIEAFGDAVLPVGYQPGRRYPLIVVQYQSRGFLRGGTGDEFPIQAFANHGYAVLSIQRPVDIGALSRPRDYIEVDRINLREFADRRNALSIVERGVQTLIADGIADPNTVGITGLSDGSSTVQFAALNSNIFSAAIVSGCCWEPQQTALLGPVVGAFYARVGWPAVSDPADEFWSHISIVKNARRVPFPVLFEAADEEFRGALASSTALREVGKPADFFVYPDENHIKWQPAHRLAAYWRSLDWFDYWLRGLLPDDPRRRADATRWAAMDRRRCGTASGGDAGRSVGKPAADPCLGVEQ